MGRLKIIEATCLVCVGELLDGASDMVVIHHLELISLSLSLIHSAYSAQRL